MSTHGCGEGCQEEISPSTSSGDDSDFLTKLPPESPCTQGVHVATGRKIIYTARCDSVSQPYGFPQLCRVLALLSPAQQPARGHRHR